MSVACGYANLPGSLHPLALDEEEDQASEPCWHLFLGHVLHARLVVVQALWRRLIILMPTLGF